MQEVGRSNPPEISIESNGDQQEIIGNPIDQQKAAKIRSQHPEQKFGDLDEAAIGSTSISMSDFSTHNKIKPMLGQSPNNTSTPSQFSSDQLFGAAKCNDPFLGQKHELIRHLGECEECSEKAMANWIECTLMSKS